ncbi:MAG: hypothetical protein RSE41_00460 [Clostridia bacterium]
MKTNYFSAINAITEKAKQSIISHIKESGIKIEENVYRLDVSENEIYCLEYLGFDGEYKEYQADALIVDNEYLEFECNRVRITNETYHEYACINSILCGLE